MDNISTYSEQLLTFNNPFFFALILGFAIISAIILVFVKVVFPLQKKFVTESQRYLLERAELMALFANMDPDPLIRIDSNGTIIQTNEASRNIFPSIGGKGKKIDEIIPSYNRLNKDSESPVVEKINNKIFSVVIRGDDKLGFSNIYLHDITQIKNYELVLESYKNKLKAFADKLDYEYEELKRSLSFELHDDIGQKLIVARLKLSDMEKYSSNEIQTDLENIYQRLREISKNLKPAEVKNLGLKLSLQSLVQNISDKSNIAGSFEFWGKDEKIDNDIESCIYRVVQESLNNIIKHSKANEFSVQVDASGNMVSIIVSDNGVGIPPEYFTLDGLNNSGTGLFGMKERIEKLKGALKINSNPEEGTVIIIQLPRRRSSNEQD